MSRVKQFYKIIFLMLLAYGNQITQARSDAPPLISVYPARSVLEIKPGGNYSGFYIVKNLSHQTLNVKVWAEDWTHMGQGKTNVSPNDWLSLPNQEVIIPSGEEGKITYEIKFSRDMTGEKLSQVFFEPSYLDTPSGMIRTRNGVLIIAIAEGTEKLDLKANSLKLLPKEKYNVLGLELSNLGNIHLKWQARITVLDDQGNEMGESLIKSPKSLLTGETQSYYGKIENDGVKGLQKLSAKISISYGIENDRDHQQEMILPILAEESRIP